MSLNLQTACYNPGLSFKTTQASSCWALAFSHPLQYQLGRMINKPLLLIVHLDHLSYLPFGGAREPDDHKHCLPLTSMHHRLSRCQFRPPEIMEFVCNIIRQIMGNNLCSDVGNDPLPVYRHPSATSARGTALMHRSQWYNSKSKMEETGIPILPEPVRNRLQQLGPFKHNDPLRGQYIRTTKFIDTNTVYAGEWTNSKPHGRGKLYFPDGSYFEGTFSDCKAIGRGRFIEANGNFYEGNFNGNEAQGEGVFGDAKGIYRGEFKNGKVHGNGIYQGKDGIFFKGRFQNGQQAQGQLIWGPQSKYSYKGTLVNNKFHGPGILRKEDGTYQGNFENGKRVGFATYIWKDGNRYQGMFQNDKKNGYGELYNAQGEPIFKGAWKDDKIAGQGLVFRGDQTQNSMYLRSISS